MSAPGVRVWVAGFALLLACVGCGFKGPLYLPEPNATVVTHPPQAPQEGAATGQAQTRPTRSKGKASPPQNPSPLPPP